MLGGSLSRYHTPVVNQGGGALVEELVKIAGPSVVGSLNGFVQDVARGGKVTTAAKARAAGVKRKAMTAAKNAYKRRRDILS